ncbi:MAG TPA: ABC transporter permease [Micromonosporaceae bacterium]|jgi:peptide/nickel transport system permease protein|nr:ABC transporter permease [Micromonosporaceae bacterium]
MSETTSRASAADAAAASTGMGPVSVMPPSEKTEREFTVKERSQLSMVMTRFLRHRLAISSLAFLVLLILVVYIAPHVFNLSYTEITNNASLSPRLRFLMGTDELGHNYLALVLRGAHQSLNVSFIVAIMSSAFGAPYGAIAAFYGGKIDAIMMRIVDVILVLPFLVVTGALSEHYSGTWYTVALLLGVTGWVINARVTRGVVLSVREQEFVEAARALGASDVRIIFRHLLPNVTGTLIVQATLDIAAAILAEAGLSFLGLGIHSPDTSLGVLAQQSQNAIQTRPWLFYFPCAMILVICLSINFIGDGLRDALDPRQTRQRR